MKIDGNKRAFKNRQYEDTITERGLDDEAARA